MTNSEDVKLVRSLVVDESSEIRDMELSCIASVVNAEPGSSLSILTVAAGAKVYFYDLSKSDNERSCLKSHKMPIHFREVRLLLVETFICPLVHTMARYCLLSLLLSSEW